MNIDLRLSVWHSARGRDGGSRSSFGAGHDQHPHHPSRGGRCLIRVVDIRLCYQINSESQWLKDRASMLTQATQATCVTWVVGLYSSRSLRGPADGTCVETLTFIATSCRSQAGSSCSHLDMTHIISALDGLVKAVTWPCLTQRVDHEGQPCGQKVEPWTSSNHHLRADGLIAGKGRSGGKGGREWEDGWRETGGWDDTFASSEPAAKCAWTLWALWFACRDCEHASIHSLIHSSHSPWVFHLCSKHRTKG